jgi:hypothetical protein
MAIQTLNTIKNWFKTGLKPSQAQFWDTWDSFRHKFEKVPVKDIDGIDELLLTKADKTILDNHLADKIAHAPQVNTDWNSESGLSQLINKPEFKTINGEAIVGDGDITISSAIPTLDQVLNSDNKSLTQPIVFLDEEYSATIDSKNLSIDGPLGEGIQYNSDNINWSKGDKNLKLLFDGESAGQNTFSFPEMPDSSTPYKLATDQVVSATQSGIVDTTSLQELGGVDKLINGVRIGRGAGNDPENSSFGLSALNANTTGTGNTAIGSEALLSNISANNNTGIGNWALRLNETSPGNTALGVNTLTKLVSGIGFNTAVGTSALTTATTASYSTAVGTSALRLSTTGTQNVAIGGSALRNLTTGNYNLGIGTNALLNTIIGSRNTAIGVATGLGITGNDNLALGYLAMGFNGVTSTGNFNIAIGSQAGGEITAGSGNILIENQQTTNSAITTGSNNVILKQGLTSTGVRTGNNNTIIGNITGLPTDASNLAILSDGSGNIAIRKETDNRLLAPGLTNALIDSGGAKSLVTKEYVDEHSGGSQNLQQTLENGGSAEFSYNGGIQELSMFDGNGAIEFYTSGEDVESGESKTSDGVINKNNILLRHTYQNTGISRNAYLDISSGKVRLQEQNNGSDALLEFEDQTGSRSTFQIPNKNPSVDTTYKLATTDDVSLQKIVDNTASATKENSGINLMAGSGGLANNFMYMSNGLSGSSYVETQFKQTPDYVRLALYKGSGNANEFIGISESAGINLYKKGETYETNIAVAEPVANTGIVFPAPSIAGNYTLATTADIASAPKPTLAQVLTAGNFGDRALAISYSDKDVLLDNDRVRFLNTTSGASTSYAPTFIDVTGSGGKFTQLTFPANATENRTFSFSNTKPQGSYTIATTDDIPTILPASATQSGIVDNTSLQELGGVDKFINGIRIGRGNNIANNANTVLGSNALTSATTSISNTAVGRSVLALNTTGSFNTGVGAVSLANLTTGTQNVALGGGALRFLTTGEFNLGIGTNALLNTITGSRNTAIGVASGQGILGNDNLALGYLAMGQNGITSTGNLNIAIGSQSGGDLTTGSGNILIENTRATGITTGSNNVILKQGTTTTGVTTGSNNTVIGNISGLPNDSSNLAILSDGSGNIAIRKEADNRLLAPTLTNALIDSGGAKSLVTKEYLIKIYTNASTTAPTTNAELDSLYPNAKEGDEVTFLEATPYSLITKKLLSGWVMYQVGKLP